MYYPTCDWCNTEDNELYWLGSERLCWDCYQAKLWSDEIVNENLDKYIESNLDEYVTWLFNSETGEWKEPAHPLLDKSEVLEMRKLYYPVWLKNHHGDREWRLDFAQADGGCDWEKFVTEAENGNELLCPA